MDEIVIASTEDLRKLLESMPDDVVITIPIEEGGDIDAEEEHI